MVTCHRHRQLGRLGLAAGALLLSGLLLSTPTPAQQNNNTVKIRITIEGQSIVAQLSDNATTRDLLAQLPLTVTLEDYGGIEKIFYPPKKLSTTGAPASHTPKAGDVAYYAPWGNIALFHGDFQDSPALIHLGRIESGGELLKVPGKRKALVERP